MIKDINEYNYTYTKKIRITAWIYFYDVSPQ